MKHSYTKRCYTLENIEALRQSCGIHDVELSREIARLSPGNRVRLTFMSERLATDTLWVRITLIRGAEFRGVLAENPNISGLSPLKVGDYITFTADHIHSLAKQLATPVT
jgi:hypothetical protein